MRNLHGDTQKAFPDISTHRGPHQHSCSLGHRIGQWLLSSLIVLTMSLIGGMLSSQNVQQTRALKSAFTCSL